MRLILLAVGAALLCSGIAGAQAIPPSPCSSPSFRAFDFWIGEWDVFARTAPNTLVAHSRIEAMFGGCAIRETWLPLSGNGGGSFSAWRQEANEWRQTWVDSSGSWAEFHGGLREGAMVLQGIWPQPGKPTQITRMTYRRLAEGNVEQIGETSDDGGKSWAPSFDFVYRRKTQRG